MIIIKIAITGPKILSNYDKSEIEDFLVKNLSEGHEIHLLAYRSLELEVFKFFVNNLDLCSKLTIYTYQNLDELPVNINNTVRFLISNGSNFRTFNHSGDVVSRNTYIESWREILDRCDSIVSFYDNEKISLMIPIDEAVLMKKSATIFYLPGNNIDKFKLPLERKMRNVE